MTTETKIYIIAIAFAIILAGLSAWNMAKYPQETGELKFEMIEVRAERPERPEGIRFGF
jgi:hypothetical protein